MLTSFYFPHTGGIEKYVQALSVALTGKGHEVTVFTHTRGQSTDPFPVHRMKALWLPYTPVLSEYPGKELSRYDLVHAHGSPYVAAKIAVKTGKPFVLTVHGDMLMPLAYKGIKLPVFFRKSADYIFSKIAEKTATLADAVVVTTDSYASTSSVFKNRDVKIIPMGVNCSSPSLAPVPGEAGKKKIPRFLFVGRLAHSKGLNVLIDASEKLKDEGFSFVTEIVGTGEEEKTLKARAEKKALTNNVVFSGQLEADSETLWQAYKNADAFVLPSLGRLESFGIVQLEAMLTGTPVIASDLPGVRVPVSRSGCGVLVKPGDTNSLYAAMKKVLQDPESWTESGKNAPAYVKKNHSLEHMAKEYENLYNQVVR